MAHVANELDYDCVLGANLHVKFNAMIDPEEHMLLLDRQETKPLEFDATGNEIERQEIERNLDGYALVVHGPSIGFTDLTEHTIWVTSTRPIEQKYYPVSFRK